MPYLFRRIGLDKSAGLIRLLLLPRAHSGPPHGLNGHIPDPPSSMRPGASNAPDPRLSPGEHRAPSTRRAERMVLSSHQPDRAHRLAGGRSPGWSQFGPAVRRGPATHPFRAAPSPRALRGPPGAGEKCGAIGRAAVLPPETGRHYFRLTSGSALVARPRPTWGEFLRHRIWAPGGPA